jgi:hypothetical protein
MKKNIYFLSLLLILFSCKKPKILQPVIVKPAYHILILGNSITYSSANPSIGWNNNCGMASTVPDSDYVHLLNAKFKSLNNNSTISAKNIALFETNFDSYDFADSLKIYRDSKPQIIIMRIGENVITSDSVGFEKKYIALLNYFTVNNPSVKILAVGSVWPDRDLANKVMSKYSSYISLASLESDLSNYAFGQFANGGIQSHPSNKGMKVISTQIWTALQPWLN